MGLFAAAAAAAVSLAGLAPAPAFAARTAAVPGPPRGVTVTAADQGAVVSWQPPSVTGGSPVTGYVIKAFPGGKSVRTAAVRSFQVGGLANGAPHRFTVAAVNKDGTGPASRPSAAVTPRAPTVPGPARSVIAVAGFQQATVTWRAPASDGGGPITGYRVTTRPATTAVTVSGAARSATVAGLSDGTSYRLSVAAVNSAGTARAVWSAGVTPRVTVPGAPVGVTAAPAGTGIRVSWQPPAATGGSAVTGYVIAVTGTGKQLRAGATARSVTVTGLASGSSYQFTVAARNAKGRGPWASSTPATAGGSAGQKTVVLSAASLAALTVVGTDGSLVFASPPVQVKSLVVGDIVVAGVSAATPGGLLAKVTSVSSAGPMLTVDTVPASLDQALSVAGFGLKTALTAGQVADFAPARPGVRMLARAPGASPGSITLSLDTDLYSDDRGRSVSVSGNITLTPSVSFWASITCCVHTASQFSGTVDASASLEVKAELSHDIGGGYTLGTLHFAPITIVVAGVPVVILPELTVTLTAKGTVSAGLSAGAGAAVTVGAQVSTQDSSVTAKPVFSRSTTWSPPTLYGTLDAGVGAKAALSATVDGIPGPELSDSLWLAKLSADPSKDPWWTLSAENVLSIDYELKLLDHVLASYSKTLSDITIPLAHAPGPYQQITITPASPVTAPGGQVQLRAQVGGAAAQNVTWNAPAGNGTITAGGLYTAPAKRGTFEITAAQPASGLKPPAYGVISIQVGHQPSSAPTNVAATAGGYGSATITWQPPADTGGGAITGYTVTAAPGGSTVSATGTSATMNWLTPGTTYTFTVTAASNGGISLPSAPSNPVLISDVNGAWAAAQSPLPNDANTNPQATFTSVACASTATCVSAGSYLINPNLVQGFRINAGLLVTNSSGKLTAAEVSQPYDAPWYASVALTSVACPSDTQCIAVGYDSEGIPDQGVVSMGLGSSWQSFETPTPAGALDDPNATLWSISCGSATSCVAVGSYTDTGNVTRGYLLTWNGGSWVPAQAPVPANAAPDGQVGLYAVNCPSATKCVAAGYYYDSSGHEHGLLLTRSGGSWTAAQVPLPAGADAANGIYLSTVACSATPVCSAFGTFIDSSSNNHLIAVTGFGSSWAPAEVPLPGNASGSVRVASAACPSPSWCVATGAYNDSSNVSHGLLVTGSGTSWTARQAPSPGGKSTTVNGVACPANSACVAVGGYSGGGGLLLRYDGVSWAAAQAPLPDSTALGSVSAVACPTVTACFAAGLYDSSEQEGLLLTGPG